MCKQQVTAVSCIDKKKIKVQLEEGEVFALYKGEARKMGIEEGAYITDTLYEEIHTLLYKRGKDRVLYLLKDSSKTTQEVRRKLQQGFYPPILIEQIIEFLSRYHYLDDSGYIQNYYEMWKRKKSKKEIQYTLLKKGLERQLIKEVLECIQEEEGSEGENDALRCQLYKKAKGKDLKNPKDRQRVIQYLMGKGFSYSDIALELERITQEPLS